MSQISKTESKRTTDHIEKYKKILLISPPFTMETGKGRKETYLAAWLPPLGMLTLAGELEKNGYEVSFIDAEAELIDDREMLRRLMKINPDVVGIYCITANYKRLVEFSKKVKDNLDVPIFFGGPHVWHHWKETIKPKEIDFAVVGEGEETCIELLDKLNKGESLKDVKGIAYKNREGKIVFTGPRPFVKDLDKLAYPAFHLVDISKYRHAPQHIKRKPSVTMITSRGCPFRCTFCYVPFMFEGTFRLRSVDHVIGEIKYLIKNYGIKEIQFYDDLFGANKKWLHEFVDRVIDEKIDITWSCLTRIDILDWTLVHKLKKSGCWCIFFGIESLNQKVLDAVNKMQTVEQIRRAIKACQKVGIEIRANLILGSPEETPEIAKKVVKELCKLNPDYVKFNVMCPYPGTKIYEEVKEGKWGRLIDDYNPELMTNHEVVFIPFGYKNAKEVLDMRKYAYRKYYFRPRYIFSRLQKIDSWHDVKRYWQGLKLVIRRYAF